MKRHKYGMLKYFRTHKENELKQLAINYIKKHSYTPEPMRQTVKLFLGENFIPASRRKSYCLLTGRVRYTIGIAQVSRQSFLALFKEGYVTGFYYASL